MLRCVAVLIAATCTVVTAPGIPTFESSVTDNSPQCNAALNSLDKPQLATCFGSPLFFSTPETVCRSDCLELAISASKTIAAACSSFQSEHFLPSDVYRNWSNEAAARAACTPVSSSLFSSSSRVCLQVMFDSLRAAEELKVGLTVDNPQDKLGCNIPCVKQVFDAVQGDGDKAPVLYYYGGQLYHDLFDAQRTHCSW